jgi:two-component system, OmpR family, response regulator
MPNSAPLKLLLVEDSALLAARLTELLRHIPQVDIVGTFDTEADALECVSSCAPDVVILDLHLRIGSGFGVLRRMHGANRPKVIVLTNFDVPAYRREAEALGADVFLDKSRDYSRLPALLFAFASERSLRERAVNAHPPLPGRPR